MCKARLRWAPVWIFIVLWALGSGCATVSTDESKPPLISSETPFEEAIRIAIRYGGKRLDEFKDYARAGKFQPRVSSYTGQLILANGLSMPTGQLLHAAHLYRFSSPSLNPELLKQLLSANSESARKRIGWQMASLMPSAEVAAAIESLMSQAVVGGYENRYIMPEMADAVLENDVRSLYSFMRLGLLAQGNDSFAKAMAALQPASAARDFMDYLAIASLDDLRQMNQETVNMYSCLVILRFYLTHPLPVADPKVAQLYLYAISRNNALSDMARAVLDRQIPAFKAQMLHYLSRQPMEVQMAFVEGTRHSPSPNIKLLLSEFKSMTAFREVEQEIESIHRY